LVELSLHPFEGYQTWIDFRVVVDNGGGKGVRLDDLAVIGNEYRNNLGIIDVVTDRYAASGGTHDLSVTVKGIGLEPQNEILVTAVMRDSNRLKVGLVVMMTLSTRLYHSRLKREIPIPLIQLRPVATGLGVPDFHLEFTN